MLKDRDTGSFGKLMSEAIENTDKKQCEGVQSTGAGAAVSESEAYL